LGEERFFSMKLIGALLGGVLGGTKLPPAQPVPAAPSSEDPAIAEARRKALLASRKATRQSTVLTSGDGLAGEETMVSKPEALGA
jgi:hypothetical protein